MIYDWGITGIHRIPRAAVYDAVTGERIVGVYKVDTELNKVWRNLRNESGKTYFADGGIARTVDENRPVRIEWMTCEGYPDPETA